MADHDGGDATYWRGLYQKAQAELLKVNDQLQVETGRANEAEASAAAMREALDRGISALNHLPPDEGPIRKLAGAAIAVMRAAKEDDVGRALLGRLCAAEKRAEELTANYNRDVGEAVMREKERIAADLRQRDQRIAELRAEVERLTAKCAEHDDERRWAHEAHKTRLKREEERDAELSRMAARIAELQAEVERLHKDADELAAARHAFEDRITIRSAELQTALGRAVATLQGERGCCWGAPICNPALGVKCTPCQRNTRIDAILADPTSAAAGEAWRELVDYVRSGGRVHIVCVDGRHDCNDVSCKQGRALLDKVDALRAQR
jgi:uncharacterized small protein (DUF1192 family)